MFDESDRLMRAGRKEGSQWPKLTVEGVAYSINCYNTTAGVSSECGHMRNR
jgi:hypothetical protein